MKHAYQLMANELKMSHVVISLVMVYLVPNTVLVHRIYLVAVGVLLVCA